MKKIDLTDRDNYFYARGKYEKTFANNLYTANQPDPDLLIRTSGEERISNFLLWQIAYTEFVFSNKYWPEFSEADLDEAIKMYQQRTRKFGGK